MVYSNNTNSKLNIDRRSAINLEIISNSKTGNQKSSLYGAINFTKTKVGSRYLKSNLLRPSTDLITIETRLDTIELLLKNNKIHNEIIHILQKFPDFDKLLYGLITIPKQLTLKTVKCSIDTLIYLKECLRLCPLMTEILQNLMVSENDDLSIPTQTKSNTNSSIPTQRNLLVTTLIDNFSDTYFHELLIKIDTIITDSTNYSRSTYEMRYQGIMYYNIY